MKKFIAAVLACSLLLCTCISCGRANYSAQKMINSKLGLYFGDVNMARDVRYNIVGGDTAQMKFMLDDAYCTARIQSTFSFTDISGRRTDWGGGEDVFVGGCSGKIMYGADARSARNLTLCLWYDPAPGLMYSLCITSDCTVQPDAVAVADQIYIPMQGEC